MSRCLFLLNFTLQLIIISMMISPSFSLFSCDDKFGNLDLSNPPCHCRYDVNGTWLVYSNSLFNNVTDTGIVATSVYRDDQDEYTKNCFLSNDHLLNCPYITIWQSNVQKNVTVSVTRKNDGIKWTANFLQEKILKCRSCDIVPNFKWIQVSWKSGELDWDFIKYSYVDSLLPDVTTSTVTIYLPNGTSTTPPNCREFGYKQTKCKVDLASMKFGDEFKICLTNKFNYCHSSIHTCKNITAKRPDLYYKHFRIINKPSCKLHDNEVELGWLITNTGEAINQRFSFKIRVYNENNEIVSSFFTNKLSYRSTRDTLRDQASYYKVQLCLQDSECSSNTVVSEVCESKENIVKYIVYALISVSVLLVLTLTCAALHHKGVFARRQPRDKKHVPAFVDEDVITASKEQPVYEEVLDCEVSKEEIFDHIELKHGEDSIVNAGIEMNENVYV